MSMKWHDKFENADNESEKGPFGSDEDGNHEDYLEAVSLQASQSAPQREDDSDRFHRTTTVDNFLVGLETHAGREYFGGWVRMT